MYSAVSLRFETYSYSLSRSRNRSKFSGRSKTSAFTGASSFCRICLVWSERLNSPPAVRSHR
jgi:hypothetical protein